MLPQIVKEFYLTISKGYCFKDRYFDTCLLNLKFSILLVLVIYFLKIPRGKEKTKIEKVSVELLKYMKS